MRKDEEIYEYRRSRAFWSRTSTIAILEHQGSPRLPRTYAVAKAPLAPDGSSVTPPDSLPMPPPGFY